MSQHKEGIYAVCVDKWNELEERLKTADRTKASPVYSEIREFKRGEAFVSNCIRLHEWYFENLGGGGGAPSGRIAEILRRDFGNLEGWEADFRSSALSSRGWVILCYDFFDGRLHNYSGDGPDQGGVWGTYPLLVLDVSEHAYTIDYGTKRAHYVDAFFKNIEWKVVNDRLEKVLSPAPVS
ncbi:MAG: superoxide dismutase [Armatimonadetes bacterium]|nr:superoxide dismutase [Armatimonadota bacterium]